MEGKPRPLNLLNRITATCEPSDSVSAHTADLCIVMSHMVAAASLVTKLVNCSEERRAADQKRRGKPKEKVHVDAHASTSDNLPSTSLRETRSSNQRLPIVLGFQR